MYCLKVITTTDIQLDSLNVMLFFDNQEEAFKHAALFIDQGYTVQLWEDTEEEDSN